MSADSGETASGGRGGDSDRGRRILVWALVLSGLGLTIAGSWAVGRHFGWFETRDGADDSAQPTRVESPPEDAPRTSPERGVDAVPSPLSESVLPTSVEGLKEAELRLVRKLVEDFPDNAAAIGLLGNVYSNHGDHSEAVKHWQRALALNPADPSGHKALGIAALRKGQYEEAERLLRKAIELDPTFPDVHPHLARVLMEQGKMEAAAAVLKQGIAVGAEPAKSYCTLGKIALQLGRTDEAKQCYEAAIRARSKCTEAYYGLYQLHARLRELERARQYMEKFREFKADDVVRDKDSRSHYDDLDTVRSTVAKTFTGVGAFHFRRGGVAGAEKCWRTAASLDPANTACRTGLATLYQRTGRDREALEICQELARIEPDNVTRHLNLGVLSARLRQFAAADEALRQAIELRPQHALGYRLLAQIQLDQGQATAETVALAETAVQFDRAAAHYFLLGVARARTGDHDGALAAIERAAQLDPSNAGYRQAYREVRERGSR